VHVSSSDVSDETEVHVPPRKSTVYPVGDVLPFCRNSKQAALKNTVQTTAIRTFLDIRTNLVTLIGRTRHPPYRFFI
jgi:hypothetical protein